MNTDPELDAVLKRLGQRLRHLRGSRTYEKAAQEVDRTVAYIKRIERGVENPTIQTLYSMAKGYGVSLSDIFEPWRQHIQAMSGEDEVLHDKLSALLNSGEDFRRIISVNIDAVHSVYERDFRKKHR